MADRYVPGMPVPTTSPDITTPKSEKPIRDVLVELWENTETLFRQELALASAEIDQKVSKLKKDAAAFALGGAFLHAGFLALVAGVILLLSQAVAPWLAALIVGGVLAVVGFFLVKRQPQETAEDLVPKRTIQSVKKDVQTFREATK